MSLVSEPFMLLLQKSFKQAFDEPEFLVSDFAKFERPGQLHLAYRTMHDYLEKAGNLPNPRSKVHSESTDVHQNWHFLVVQSFLCSNFAPHPHTPPSLAVKLKKTS